MQHPTQSPADTTTPDSANELDAYNAAFYSLGLRFHWDAAIYDELQTRVANRSERIEHYLQTRQPHILKAYDAEFLTRAIEQSIVSSAKRLSTDAGRPFDWSAGLGREIGN